MKETAEDIPRVQNVKNINNVTKSERNGETRKCLYIPFHV